MDSQIVFPEWAMVVSWLFLVGTALFWVQEIGKGDKLKAEIEAGAGSLRTKMLEAEAARRQAEAAIANADRQTRMAKMSRSASRDDVDALIKEALGVQYRSGRGISAIAMVTSRGIIVEWRVENGDLAIPEVVGSCDGRRTFREFAFRGRHADRLPPGHHQLAFAVNPAEGQKKRDLVFDIVVPEAGEDDGSDWKKQLDAKAKRFFERDEYVADMKRDLEARLRAKGWSEEEIEVRLSQFEVLCQEAG